MPILRAQRMPRTAAGREKEAIALVRANVSSLRVAGAKYHIAKSTLHDKLKRSLNRNQLESKPRGRKNAFTAEEESVIVELLCKYSDKGIPLLRRHLIEACAIFISTMPVNRRKLLPFKYGVPGNRFIRCFIKRHSNTLCFSKPLRQEPERFRAVNAEVLVEHFAQLEKLIKTYNIDDTRIWNLDECGGTPGRDVIGNTHASRITRKHGGRDYKLPAFVRTNRVTLMPVVSASGDTGPPLFVFKGKLLLYRTVLQNGQKIVQTYHSVLPRCAVVAMREEHGGVDGNNFYQWAEMFIQHVHELTVGGRKVLLTYDGYRSHMSIRVLELFSKNNVEVYALPAHSSGKTQPLDVILFSAYKTSLNNLLDTVCDIDEHVVLDEFDYCTMMREAYYKTFTRENIASGFRRAGMWPCDPNRLINIPRIRDDDTVASVEMLEQMMNDRRNSIRQEVLGANTKVLQSGFVYTKRGAVLTAEYALNIARTHAEKRRLKNQEKELTERKRSLRKEQKERKMRREIVRHEEARWRVRAFYAGMDPLDFKASVRSLKERREVAKIRSTAKKLA